MIMTDEFGGYPSAIAKAGVLGEHKTVCHSDGEYVNGDIYTNGIESAFSLLKRSIVGTWHRVSAKHLQSYLDEMCFRFDNRNNPYLFRDTLLNLLKAEHLSTKNSLLRRLSSVEVVSSAYHYPAARITRRIKSSITNLYRVRADVVFVSNFCHDVYERPRRVSR